jgi:hypothetical protein
MADRGVVPPVRSVEGGFEVTLPRDERDLLIRLLRELSSLLISDDDGHRDLLSRLFPPAYPDDEDKEAEYQRLMREELVASRLAAIEEVATTLGPDGPEMLDEEQLVAFAQSINAVRLVLGSMLGVTDDDTADDAEDGDTSEHHLYTFLSWLLEWTVQALSGRS